LPVNILSNMGKWRRRHSSEVLSSPRRPSSTILILSSADQCRRVARRLRTCDKPSGHVAGRFGLEMLFFEPAQSEVDFATQSSPTEQDFAFLMSLLPWHLFAIF
jgi:hypothetical protein